MNARNKLALDRILARPIAFLLELIVWPLGKILYIDHDNSPEKVKVIAIAKIVGMGSILRATPLVRVLKRRYPSTKYIFITSLSNKPIIESLPFFNKHFYIRDSSPFKLLIDSFVLLSKLWKSKIDFYFDLEVYSAFSTILATLSLARNRYGFYNNTTRFRLGLHTHLVYFNEHQHISRIYLQLAQACGANDLDIDYRIEKMSVVDEKKTELNNWLEANNIKENSPYITINPNASDLLLERRWPMDYFASLINVLAKNWHNPIFLLGGPNEYQYNNSLYHKLSEEAKKIVSNTAGKISLQAVVVIISRTKLMITNDSGLYHIASSFDVPIISLWGPGDPRHYADIDNPNDTVFYCKKVYCSPCLYKTDVPPCRGNNVCMKSISPLEVYKKACQILEISCTANTSEMDEIFRKECYGDDPNTYEVTAQEKSNIPKEVNG